MGKFLDSANSIKREAGRKKKKQETPQPKQTTQSPSVSQNTQNVVNRMTQKYGGGSSGGSYGTRSTGNQTSSQRQNQKSYGQPEQPMRRNQAELQRQAAERRSRDSFEQDRSRVSQSRNSRMLDTARGTKTESITEYRARQEAARRQKSGYYEKPISREQYADKSRATTFREKYTRWDNDIADTIGHTLKQTAAEDKKFINKAARGITLKDRSKYATEEQIRKADERTEMRDKKYASQIEKEGEELEKLKKGHGYLGQQALSAVSSATGMAADMAAGAATGTGELGSLSHMFMRSTAGAEGQVKKKADRLRKQLEASGNYTPEELDEMFKDVDRRDELNAIASGGIEVLSELLFRGFGPAAKYVGKGGSIAERAAGKLFNKAGSRATSGMLKNALRGTAEEVAEEEIGGPLQALAANAIYGNKYQNINEDAIKREFKSQSDALRGQIHSDQDAQMVTARLNSSEFMNDSIKAYMDSGMSENEARHMAELSKEYLTASLSGDLDKMSEAQKQLVDNLAGGEKSLKEKFTFKDAMDAAVSTSMMTLATGIPGAVNSAQIGKSYKGTNGLEGVRNLAEMVRNWDVEESSKAQKVIDAIDNGSDISDTQVYELMQKAGSSAETQREAEATKEQITQRGMQKYDLRVAPVVRDEYGNVDLSENTQQRFDKIVNDTVSRYDSLAKIGEMERFEKANVKQGASLAASMMTGVITADDVHELVKAGPEVKAVFQDVTGIALDQFTKRDRNGDIDIAATNNNIMNSLMADAAMNYIDSARLEQAAWANDVRGEMLQTMSDNLNSRGDEALLDVLQTVDPRDRDTFMLTGMASQYVYEHGWSTQDTWEEAKGTLQQMFPSLSVDSLQGVYEAAKMDRIESETPFLNASVKTGEAISDLAKSGQKAVVRGKFKNRTKRVLNAEETVICTSLAKQFNANITMVGEKNKNLSYIDENGEEKFSNAAVVLSKGEIYISKKADISKIIHEVTHMGAKLASTQYLDMAHYIMDKAYKHDPNRTRMLVEAYRRTYQGQNLTDAQIEEEVVSDIVTAFEHDSVFLREIAQEEPSLFRRIYNAICDVLRSLRNILATGKVLDPELQDTFLAEIGAYEETRRMWIDMMHEAARNNAAVGLAKWESNAYQDSRESRRVSNDVLAARDDTAIFIKNTKSANYIDMILNGEKTEETRATRTLDKFVGKEVAVTDGEQVYGTVVLGEPHKYTSEEFHGDEAQLKHRVPVGDKYDDKNGKGKWAYPIESYTKYDEPKLLSKDKDYLGSYQAREVKYSITPEQQETIEHNVGPDVRFSVPTWRDNLAKAIFNSSEGFSAYSGKQSGRQKTYELTKNNFSEEQAKAVTDYMDMMAAWFEKTGEGSIRAKYKFIGWDDLTKAEVQVRKNDKDEIVSLTVSAMVKNGEYPVNFDLTTVCNKREGFSEVIKNLIDTKVPGTNENVLNTIKLTDKNMWKINQALKAEGIDTACLGCFVEARRYYAQNFMNKIDDKWNSAVRKARRELGLPEEEYFNFAKGKEVSGEEWSAIDDLWSAYDESKESKSSPADRIKILMDEIVKNKETDSPYLKLIQMSDISTPEGYNAFKQLSTKGHDMVKTIKSIYGTSAPKEILAFTPYNSEIALLPDNMKGMPTGDYLRSIGGIRVQSFSDFKIEHVFDHFQMVADEAARKFVTHGYSKVIAFPRIFGLTGRKINMSVMFDVLPNRAWSQVLGIPVRKAAKYAKKYQGLQFVKEKPAENPDNRPYIETEIEGVHGYLTYLVSDADYVNSVRDREYQKNLDAGMSEDEARRKANEAKPFEQSINYKDAVELENQEGYKENIGIIAVAYGDEHLRVLMSDPNVRYIIPYHKSGLPTFISKKTSLAIARDYTNFQNTNIAESWKDANGKEVDFRKEFNKFVKEHKDEKYPAIEFFKHINDNKYKVKFGSKTASQKSEMAGTADFDVYKDLDSVKDIREVSNAYLEHCIKNGWCPVFHEFAGDPNYYKMIFDFAVTDGTTTNIYPQRTVRNNYPGLDIDAKVAAGEEITEADLEGLKEAVEKGAKEQNDKNMIRSNNMGNVMNDLLSRDTENSIIADTNLQSIRWGTPDYTDVKLGNEEMTPEETDADVRLSISVNLDDDYMDAVNSGNMEEAQRLVDEAAKMAGFKPVHRYHGTMNAGFTVFDKAYAKVGGNSGAGFYFSTEKDDSANHYADVEGADNYFKWSELADRIHDAVSEGTWEGAPELGVESDDIETYEDAVDVAKRILNKNPGTFDVYLNYHNPYIRDGANSTNLYDMLTDEFDESAIDRADYEDDWEYDDAVWEARSEHVGEAIYSAVYGAYQDMENNYEILDMPTIDEVIRRISEYAFDGSLTWKEIEDAIISAGDVEVTNPNWTDSGYATPEFTRAIIENLGFDAIEDKEVSKKFGQLSREMMTDTEHIIVFKPEQIKLSDPVTYAEDGSVIPLSERFDTSNNDIRYSLPTQDSDGNILTDGQMEYFKNSQARDSQGRLAVVYHSTENGGFTIFDPEYSDDRRSIFFTDNYEMSRSYSGGGTDFNSMNFGLPEPGKISTLSDVLRYFDGLSQEQEDQIGVYLYDDSDTTYEYRPQSWSNNMSLADYIDEYGDTPDDGVRGEYYDGITGEIIGEFNTLEEMTSELKGSVTYINENIGGTSNSGERGTYACYLKLENPLILECDGANWNSILDPYFKPVRISYDGESYYKDNTTIPWTLDELREDYGDLFVETLQNEDAYDLDGMGKLYYVGEDQGEVLDPEVDGMPLEGNTRFWCEEAEDMGHDGVIFRDLQDYGTYSRGYGYGGDVYVAFSSNQVKDTRNENPSENADIRYSKVDEDEAMSIMAHDYAYDTSHELLLHYEQMMDGLQDKDTANAYKKAKKFVGEHVDEFYSGLTWYADGMKFDDPVLEEGRERMASSKADFFSSNVARWNEKWLTEGRVLDARSVRSPIRKLVMSIMKDADTEYKYKTDLVNKTIVDVRMAYDYAKQGRTEIADALLWHSALRMIDGVDFIDDSVYREYKGLRDYLRTAKISLNEEYWSDIDFGAFRKRNYNRINLVSGNTNVDQIYQELCELYPEWFTEEEATPPDQLARIEQVLNAIQPYTIAYSSEEAADMAFDIASDLTRIMREEGKEYKSIADKYKEKYEERTKALKARHQEALKEAAENSKKLEQKAKAKFKEYKAEQKEAKYHKKYFESIKNSHDELVKRLRTNTKDKHIPEQYKRELANILAAFDFQTVRSKKLETKKGADGYERLDLSKKTIQMRMLQGTLRGIENNSQFFRVNDSITDIMDNLLGTELGTYSEAMNVEGKTLDELNSDQLKKIDKMLKALIHEFNNYENVRVGKKKQKAAEIGARQIEESLAHAAKYGAGKDYHNFPGVLDNILNMDELTPAYLFRQVDANGDGIGMMFGELRKSFDRYVRNQAQLNEWIGEIVGKYHDKGILWNKYGSGELSKWRSASIQKTFILENGKPLHLTPAQMMSIHCLAKRPQAYNHMTGAGIVVKPVSFEAKLRTDLKQRANYALPIKLTDSDIKMIEGELTPEQADVADKLQELMATKMAEWGNEASMNVLGIRLFEDKNYFPIKSDKAALEKDFSDQQFSEMIRNFGFTKAVAPGARNAIAIDDIFDVVAEHCNNMNLYNAYTESLNDFTKVYNYHQLGPDDSDYSVEQAIAYAHSQKAVTFIRTFIKDLNGNVSKDSTTGIEQAMNDMLGKAKKASVFANGRVALQQPTALVRAFAVINPKYLKGAKAPTKANLKEMYEHCPIALWKSWGYYDINMGKSVEDLMMNNGSWAEDKMSDIYGKLDNATWCVLWNMCKAEIKEKHPDVAENTDPFWELCNERMTEVVDLTQVVDSPFHRSHAMRRKNVLVKMSTAFMAEPTLTYNMIRDGIKRTQEAFVSGNKAEASKILGRTASVFILQAATVAGAAAIWDAVRHKKPDKDDEDERFWHLWWMNAVENFRDNLKLWNNVYYVKDIASLFDGWNINNLGMQGFVHLRDAWFQLSGKKKVQSSLNWYQNFFAGWGYLTGVPFKTMMNDAKAIMNLLGVHPGFLDAIDAQFADVQSAVQDLMGGEAAANGYSNTSGGGGGSKTTNDRREAKAGSNEAALPAASRGWTYDNAPFHVEDGSLADKFLNHFGVNLTAAEIKAIEDAEKEREVKAKIDDIKAKTESLSGEEKDKKVWSYVTSYIKSQNEDKSLDDIIAEGDFGAITEMEAMYIRAGGNDDYFDELVSKKAKTALKKSISSDNTAEQIQAQAQIKNYLLDSGVSRSELSEIAYKSYTAKDLKIAFRINDKEAMITELNALVQAGLTEEDYQKLWDNRNRIDIKKYKESGGKYADRLKSTGVYNWPINGSITSRFGPRSSPGGVGSTYHQGLDIAGSMGDPIAASDGGTVVYVGWYGGAGKTVMIEHDDGTVTQYSHMSWYDAKVGDIVAQGQYIGKVGSTGNSTGPHLHFAVKVNGEYQDPLGYLNKNS